uniref:ATP synthase complex subunit 8 n=1 Tax=Sigmops gracilis TaxID=48457 RepID=Q9XPF8_SIGGR|nr:ATP synthase F0 subunit 8 [Sigmops gracilis]BAA82489.1 adenosine triphosphatase subunit 8 [Sigmops gracilis]
MPQLNPAPWLSISLLAWLILLTLIPPKILAHFTHNKLTPGTEKTQTKPWDWSWY